MFSVIKPSWDILNSLTATSFLTWLFLPIIITVFSPPHFPSKHTKTTTNQTQTPQYGSSFSVLVTEVHFSLDYQNTHAEFPPELRLKFNPHCEVL